MKVTNNGFGFYTIVSKSSVFIGGIELEILRGRGFVAVGGVGSRRWGGWFKLGLDVDGFFIRSRVA